MAMGVFRGCVRIFECVFSDVYVFGVGNEVKKDLLNALASQKRGERHVFILKDFKTLGNVFNSIISEYSFRFTVTHSASKTIQTTVKTF